MALVALSDMPGCVSLLYALGNLRVCHYYDDFAIQYFPIAKKL